MSIIWQECKPYVIGGFILGLVVIATIHICLL